MKGPFARFSATVESTDARIQETLDRVEVAAAAITIAVAFVGIVAISALLLAASVAERQ